MKIVESNKAVKFSSLKSGDCFRAPNGDKGIVCMKTTIHGDSGDKVNSVSLGTGQLMTFSEIQMVIPQLNSHIQIE